MNALAPEPVLRGILRVVYVAGYTTRNWSLDESISREQLYDLWEAVHELPSSAVHWRDDSETFILVCLDDYDMKWQTPRLREIYEQARDETTT